MWKWNSVCLKEERNPSMDEVGEQYDREINQA